MILKDLNIDHTWSLFLDRDGVINQRIVGAYVTKWDEFIFLPCVKESLALFSKTFGRIFIVTNQQGIGKGMMSEKDLINVHQRMEDEIINSNGRIDKIYFSPHLEKEMSPMRKPSTGMGLQAKIDFPEISFEKSILAGDSVSDLVFGRNLGMKTVFITQTAALSDINKTLYDYHFESLHDFSLSL